MVLDFDDAGPSWSQKFHGWFDFVLCCSQIKVDNKEIRTSIYCREPAVLLLFVQLENTINMELQSSFNHYIMSSIVLT